MLREWEFYCSLCITRLSTLPANVVMRSFPIITTNPYRGPAALAPLAKGPPLPNSAPETAAFPALSCRGIYGSPADLFGGGAFVKWYSNT